MRADPGDHSSPPCPALRTPQDLNALYVDQIQELAIPARQVESVDVNTHRAIHPGTIVPLPDAANPYLGATALVDLQSRGLVTKIFQVGDARITQLVARKGCHRNRHILDGLLVTITSSRIPLCACTVVGSDVPAAKR
jgi:hypothetical protein